MEKSLGRRISVVRYTGVLVACVARVSARVRRENWTRPKKQNEGGGERKKRCCLLSLPRPPSPFIHMGVRYIEVPLFHCRFEVELEAISTLLLAATQIISRDRASVHTSTVGAA